MTTKSHFKFRLLCKACNSYRYTRIETVKGPRVTRYVLRCEKCDISADHLDEMNGPNELDGALE